AQTAHDARFHAGAARDRIFADRAVLDGRTPWGETTNMRSIPNRIVPATAAFLLALGAFLLGSGALAAEEDPRLMLVYSTDERSELLPCG
ncbi:MAG: hypothetical protein QGH59_01110, partial [Gemmatimonadota bacterium]|nr:hypothetical protein [Gemmatimonadota bacterium]